MKEFKKYSFMNERLPKNPVIIVTGILEVDIGTKSGASSSDSIGSFY